MKKRFTLTLCSVLTACVLLFSGCVRQENSAQIVATTLPVYNFTSALCEGTGLTVTQLVNEPVSCLHNYTLQVSQMRTVESAQVLVMTGAGYEGFLGDILTNGDHLIDASQGIELACSEHHHHHDHDAHVHKEEAHEHEGHHHSVDPHIWMSPVNAMKMVQNIAFGLSSEFPAHKDRIQENLNIYMEKLQELDAYAHSQLDALQYRELITFHNGFHYLAHDYNLNIIKAIEEEPGSETSAAELKELITFVREHQIPAIFTETNGSSASANVIAAETECSIYTLDMVMYHTDYFKAMYHNIDSIKEALG